MFNLRHLVTLPNQAVQLTEAGDAIKVSESKVLGKVCFALRPSLKRIEVWQLSRLQAAARTR
jgi:hypothetical protein